LTGRLRKEGTVFITIGTIFAFLNLFINTMGQEMHPWYIVYTAFFLLAIRQHINKDFMLAKLGSFSLPAPTVST